jgi:hypothetical protein
MAMLDPGKMRDRVTFQRKAAPSGGRLNAPRKTDWEDAAGPHRRARRGAGPAAEQGGDGIRRRDQHRAAAGADPDVAAPRHHQRHADPGASPEDNVTRTMRIVAGPAFIGERREGIELMAEEVSGGAELA